eukprot:1186225-Prorocentrum_minimum.AAC.3
MWLAFYPQDVREDIREHTPRSTTYLIPELKRPFTPDLNHLNHVLLPPDLIPSDEPDDSAMSPLGIRSHSLPGTHTIPDWNAPGMAASHAAAVHNNGDTRHPGYSASNPGSASVPGSPWVPGSPESRPRSNSEAEGLEAYHGTTAATGPVMSLSQLAALQRQRRSLDTEQGSKLDRIREELTAPFKEEASEEKASKKDASKEQDESSKEEAGPAGSAGSAGGRLSADVDDGRERISRLSMSDAAAEVCERDPSR